MNKQVTLNSNKKDVSEAQGAVPQDPTAAAKSSNTPQNGLAGRRKVFLVGGAGIVVVALVAVALVLSTHNNTNPSTPSTGNRQKVSIGLLSLFSGDYIAVGQDRLNAINLAKKDLNLSNVDISVETKDSQCDGDKALEGFRELVAKNHVGAVIGEECSSSALAIAPEVEKSKVVLISGTATAPSLSQAGDYFFRTVPSDAQQGKFAANLIADKGHKRVAGLYDDLAYGKGLNGAFSAAMADKNLKLIDDQEFPNASIDVKSQLAHIAASKPDAIYIMSSDTGSSAAILLEIKRLGIPAVLFGSESLKSTDLARDAGDAAEGLVVTAVTDGTAKFKQHYLAEYGVEASDYEAQIYDAYTALALAIKNGAKTGTQIKDYLYKESFEGATGPIQFDSNGDVKSYTYDTLVIQNGQFQPYK